MLLHRKVLGRFKAGDCNPCYNGMLSHRVNGHNLKGTCCNPCYNGMLSHLELIFQTKDGVVILVIMECSYTDGSDYTWN